MTSALSICTTYTLQIEINRDIIRNSCIPSLFLFMKTPYNRYHLNSFIHKNLE